MERGNPGASTPLADVEPQDGSQQIKKEGRVEGRQKREILPLIVLPLTGRRTS